MKPFFLLSFFLFLTASSTLAQNDTVRTFSTDNNIIQDKRVNELVMKHILINEAKKGKTKGFRVQIHSGSERNKALDVKSKFSSSYPATPAYLDYQVPYFKIRVGDFRTKLEAYKFLQEILREFSGSYIVQDEIELPPL